MPRHQRDQTGRLQPVLNRKPISAASTADRHQKTDGLRVDFGAEPGPEARFAAEEWHVRKRGRHAGVIVKEGNQREAGVPHALPQDASVASRTP
jgi:hypothetical protein